MEIRMTKVWLDEIRGGGFGRIPKEGGGEIVENFRGRFQGP